MTRPQKTDAIPAANPAGDQQTIHQDREGIAAASDLHFEVAPPSGPGVTPLYRLGDYELLAEIGRGGMGVVYKALQTPLNRIVAVKMILGGLLAKPEDLQRFNTEAAAASQLQHSGIVALHEAGTHEGQPYFSMEYIQGSSLAHRALQGPLPGQQCAGYLEKTARAVHYAHQRGIIHRDLKPANVLLDEHDQPKITDFGLAKLVQTESGQTRTGAVVGTPSYMAPEQAAARKDVGTACDIYSLGAILYELLTGKPPFRGETALATLNMVVDQDPVAPRLFNPKVDADLETICLKCLEKEPNRRYLTADALADDLRRYLDHEPIAARRLGKLGRSMKWCRRKPAMAGLVAVSSAALLAVVIGGLLFGWLQHEQAEQQREAANKERSLRKDAETAQNLANLRADGIEHLLYLAQIRQAEQALDAADLDRAAKLLDRWKPKPKAKTDLRDWEWYYVSSQVRGRAALPGHAPARTVALSYRFDGKHLASAGGEEQLPGEVKVWDVQSGELVRILRGHRNSINAVVYSPNGKLLATASDDRTVRLWDASTGEELAVLRGLTPLRGTPGPLPPLAAARLTGLIAPGPALPFADAALAVGATEAYVGHADKVKALAFSPDGKRLATAGGDRLVKIWDVRDPKQAARQPPVATLVGHGGTITSLAFAPNGVWLASGSHDQTAIIWDWATGTAKHHLKGHSGSVLGLAFNRDGTLLATVGGSGPRWGEVRLWDSLTGNLRLAHEKLSDRVMSVAFSRDGKLATAGSDGLLRIWDQATLGEAARFRGAQQHLFAVVFRPDATQLATAGSDGRIRLWNPEGTVETRTLPTHPQTEAIAFHPESGSLAVAGRYPDQPGEVRFWNLKTGALEQTLRGHGGGVLTLAFSTDGRYLATAGDDHTIRLHDLKSAEAPLILAGHDAAVRALAFDPLGHWLVSASDDGTVRLWNARTGQPEKVFKGHTNGVLAVAFHRDGHYVASGGVDKELRIWDIRTGESQRWKAHGDAIHALAFSPDGGQLATGSADRTVRLWNWATRSEFRKLEGTSGAVAALAYHPQGRRLASVGQDRSVRLWDLMTGQEILELEGSTNGLRSVAFSRDGRSLACGGDPMQVRVWETPAP